MSLMMDTKGYIGCEKGNPEFTYMYMYVINKKHHH